MHGRCRSQVGLAVWLMSFSWKSMERIRWCIYWGILYSRMGTRAQTKNQDVFQDAKLAGPAKKKYEGCYTSTGSSKNWKGTVVLGWQPKKTFSSWIWMWRGWDCEPGVSLTALGVTGRCGQIWRGNVDGWRIRASAYCIRCGRSPHMKKEANLKVPTGSKSPLREGNNRNGFQSLYIYIYQQN